jgi:hypothetical protein
MSSATTLVGAPLDLSQRSSRNSNAEYEITGSEKSSPSNLRNDHHHKRNSNLKSDLIEKKIRQLKKTLEFPPSAPAFTSKHGGIFFKKKNFLNYLVLNFLFKLLNQNTQTTTRH